MTTQRSLTDEEVDKRARYLARLEAHVKKALRAQEQVKIQNLDLLMALLDVLNEGGLNGIGSPSSSPRARVLWDWTKRAARVGGLKRDRYEQALWELLADVQAERDQLQRIAEPPTEPPQVH